MTPLRAALAEYPWYLRPVALVLALVLFLIFAIAPHDGHE